MSSGMNTEQAKEYAKTMTYTEAVSNIKHAKGIKYRKATMIKIRELAEIADRFDSKTEPQTCDTCKYGEDKHRYAHICNECGVGINNYEPKDEPQTERSE